MDVEHVVVMGVSGTGKSTVGQGVAQRLERVFVEGDDLHPGSNVARMSAGRPLDDDERVPWLRSVRDAMTAHAQGGASTVVACSALRRSYRDVLREAAGRVRFVLLEVPAEDLRDRVARRRGHWMPASLLESQLATLEPFHPDEDAVVVPVAGAPEVVVRDVVAALV